ncbi:monocarboxylate transporter 2-like [Amphiura filiformis]|uniref:monocarboxylate transporter 2-like n=1 Tax=Amphiura filiformis TaxID=82378 RepID=UPI003B220C8E
MATTTSDVDSNRAWFVALCAHVCIMIHEGLIKALGVMIPEITEYFNTSTWVVGLIIAMMPAIGSLMSLSAGPLGEKVSSRSIIMVCGLIGATGLVICSWVTKTITGFGVVLIGFTGVSLRLSFVMSTSILGQYFSRYYAIANSIAFLGSSSGIIIFAPLTQYLIIEYGWRGTLLILGGICAHVIVCGGVMKEAVTDDGDHETLQEVVDIKVDDDDVAANASMNTENATEYAELHEHDEGATEHTPLNVKSIPIPKEDDKLDKYGLHLFCNVKFLALLLSTFVGMFVYAGWMVYLVPHAKGKGLVTYGATSLATAGGIGSLIGKIVISPILDRKIISPTILLTMGLLLSGISLILDSFCSNYVILIMLSVVFGFTLGTTMLIVFVMMIDITGVKNLPKAVAWIFVVTGAARMLAGFFIGWLYELTGNYDASWIVMGSMNVFVAFIISIDLVYKCIDDLHSRVLG